jgi:hypothetical protein
MASSPATVASLVEQWLGDWSASRSYKGVRNAVPTGTNVFEATTVPTTKNENREGIHSRFFTAFTKEEDDFFENAQVKINETNNSVDQMVKQLSSAHAQVRKAHADRDAAWKSVVDDGAGNGWALFKKPGYDVM